MDRMNLDSISPKHIPQSLASSDALVNLDSNSSLHLSIYPNLPYIFMCLELISSVNSTSYFILN